jgi:hypothetical protein
VLTCKNKKLIDKKILLTEIIFLLCVFVYLGFLFVNYQLKPVPMFVNFLHGNKNCSAYIVWNIELENVIIAYLLDFNFELGYEVIFRKDNLNQWDTSESIKAKHPSSYNSLCEKLNRLFPGSIFLGANLYEKEFAA